MSTRKFRFAVGDPNEMHSGAWTIWTQGDELYAAQTLANGWAKVSVHASGVVRFASVDDSFKIEPRFSDPRVAARWTIAPSGSPGWVLCLVLNFPNVYIERRFDASALTAARRAAITWVPQALMPYATTVSLFRWTDDSKSPHDLNFGGRHEILSTLSLRSGGVVKVVAHRLKQSDRDLTAWQSEVNAADFTWEGGGSSPSGTMAAIFSPVARAEYPLIREVALGHRNFHARSKE